MVVVVMRVVLRVAVGCWLVGTGGVRAVLCGWTFQGADQLSGSGCGWVLVCQQVEGFVALQGTVWTFRLGAAGDRVAVVWEVQGGFVGCTWRELNLISIYVEGIAVATATS